MTIHGSCHCGNIAYDLDWEPEPAEIPARACDCSFCTRHGGLWTSNPQGALVVTVKDPALVTKYVFGTQTATFHICKACGIVPVVTSEIEGRLYAVVSVNAFEGVDRSRIRPAPISYQSEDVGSRLARRQKRWIGDVTWREG